MKQHHLVGLASVAATLGATLFLAGCPGNNPSPSTSPTPTPTVGPTTSPNLAKEYLFPNKLNGTYTYSWVRTTEDPTTGESSTSMEVTLKTVSLDSNQAVIVLSVGDTPISTYSLQVKNGGVEATVQELNTQTGITTTSKEMYVNDTFTETGSTITAATGSTGAMVVKRVGTETLTAASESFSTLKLRGLEATPSAAPTYRWVAKHMGLMGIKLSQVSTSSAAGGVATQSTEALLTEYTK